MLSHRKHDTIKTLRIYRAMYCRGMSQGKGYRTHDCFRRFNLDETVDQHLARLAAAARVSKSHVVRVALGRLWRSFELEGANVLELENPPSRVRRFMPPAPARRPARKSKQTQTTEANKTA
jgi:hypothetical protein